MIWDFAVSTTSVARKDYCCDAAEWIENAIGYYALSDEQLAIYEAAKLEGFRILKGTRYSRTQGFFDGEFCVFRARLDLDQICRDLGVYEAF